MTAAHLPAPSAPGVGSVRPGDGEPAAARGGHAHADAWPHTRRLLPWSLAAFLVMLWLIPFDSVYLPLPLPVESTLDRFVLPTIGIVWIGALGAIRKSARPQFRLTSVDAMVWTLVGIAALSLLVNLHTLVALDQFHLGVKKTGLLVSLVVFFYLVATSLQPSELRAFTTLLVGLAAITALGVIHEYRSEVNLFYDWAEKILPSPISVGSPPQDPKFGRETISGPTSHPIAIATMLAMAIPFAVTGYMRSRLTRRKLLYGVALTLIVAACFATVRRTGALGPFAALTVLLLYRPRQMFRLLPLGILIVLSTQIMAPDAISRVKAQFVGGFFQDQSVQARTRDYDPVVPDIREGLALGRGYGTYDPDYYRFLDNEYLGRVIETGVIGAVVYLFLVLAVIRVAHRAARSRDPVWAPIGVSVAAGAAAYGVTNIVFDALAFPQAPYMFLFLAGLAVVAATAPASAIATAPVATRRAPRRDLGFPDRHGAASRRHAVEKDEGRPDLSVVVVTHNGRDKALAAIRSARACAGTAEVEWLVVDSGSSDGTPVAIARRWPDMQLHLRTNIGFAAANNVALSEASGHYVLLMNPDVEVREGKLADLVAAMDARPDVGAASVTQLSASGVVRPSIGRFPTGVRQFGEALMLSRLPGLRGLQEMETRGRRYRSERAADWLVGAFLIVRREVLQEVGALDERFFLYSEEKDWCYRIRRAGWGVRHLPDMAVIHHTGGYGSPQLAAQLAYSKVLFARKHCGRLRCVTIRGGLALRHGLRAAALAPVAMFSPARRARVRNERAALAVVLRPRPPFWSGA